MVLFVFFVLVASVAFYFLTGKKENKEIPATVQKTTPALATPSNEATEFNSQLENARQFLVEGKVPEAFIIYSNLSKKQVPEAMYYYGKLALQNKNANLRCSEAFDLLKRASDKGYTPAKRTFGFLYSFADDQEELQQANYYKRCSFAKNISKGSKLLMEATLQGDTTASRYLDLLNDKY